MRILRISFVQVAHCGYGTWDMRSPTVTRCPVQTSVRAIDYKQKQKGKVLFAWASGYFGRCTRSRLNACYAKIKMTIPCNTITSIARSLCNRPCLCLCHTHGHCNDGILCRRPAACTHRTVTAAKQCGSCRGSSSHYSGSQRKTKATRFH